jgi:hypothetical protein
MGNTRNCAIKTTWKIGCMVVVNMLPNYKGTPTKQHNIMKLYATWVWCSQ